ncbi:hypothetical protein [Falsiroseomonas ponticola]|uniref:hypothetical protein n=1 Tax=Falsiroseomonas ponticola TaxID=2786951 RepID=UPI0019331BF8|nr:hypothetical protein [Roseomonas ponticola]
MAVQSRGAGRRAVFPRVLLFGAATAAMIAAVVNDLPGLLLGAVGLGWAGALFALVAATQGGMAGEESGAGDGGDEGGDSDGGSDGGGGDGGGE